MSQSNDFPNANPAPSGQGSGALKIVLIIVGVVLALGVLGCGVLAALLLPAISAARDAARQQMGANNLRQIGLAVHNYHDAYKAIPAAHGVNSKNEPAFSWRVSLAPFVDDRDGRLVSPADWGKPWDDPENAFLLEAMPPVYRSPLAPADQPEGHSNVFTIRHPDSVFPEGGVYHRFRDVSDGLSNTLMAIELPTRSVPWTKPEDISLEEALAEIRASENRERIHLIFMDGMVVELGDMSDEDFAAMVTKGGGEPVGY